MLGSTRTCITHPLWQVGIGHSLLAYSSTQKGLGKLQLNREALAEDLDASWEVCRDPL